ncbi:MAG TPA: hypothetical protein VJ242_04265 [Patescibacteria group bacterium]|nr:hypothetical protein [Patescibacteria group bacterium]
MKWLVGLMTLMVFTLAGWFWLVPKPFEPIALETKIINLGQVEVSVVPQDVVADKPVVFKLDFTTHSIDLDYDLTQVVSAQDDRGNTYIVSSWSGGSGGHHLQGELTLAPLQSGVKQLILSFKNINGEGGELMWQL